MENKNHWYDGFFYDLFIAPNQDKMFAKIRELIKPDSTILDVGCGTGRFSFFISDKCNSVTGIDLSIRNIERAESNLKKNPNKKIKFLHTDIEYIIKSKLKFDYAVITYVIHEVDESGRIKLLNDIASVAEKVIIGDYLVPQKRGIWFLINELVEFIAGEEHYRNYKNFIKNGGIPGLVQKTELVISKEIQNDSSSSHILLLEKSK